MPCDRHYETGQNELNAMSQHNLEKIKDYTWDNAGRDTYNVYLECLKK